ncbi:hypothetical protein [Colletotrichum fructicola RNA virus 1]|nr:hypothetical protein [Colletotrichum fructicola RNA virus 1]
MATSGFGVLRKLSRRETLYKLLYLDTIDAIRYGDGWILEADETLEPSGSINAFLRSRGLTVVYWPDDEYVQQTDEGTPGDGAYMVRSSGDGASILYFFISERGRYVTGLNINLFRKLSDEIRSVASRLPDWWDMLMTEEKESGMTPARVGGNLH